MALRTQAGRALETVIGKQRTDRVRALEKKLRGAQPSAPKPVSSNKPAQAAPPKTTMHSGVAITTRDPRAYGPSDPFAEFPKPAMSRHTMLGHLHTVLTPRTYLEVGVAAGKSMAQSRTKSIGIDPAYSVTSELECEVQLNRQPSDDYFNRPDVLSFFEGLPIDLAFLDGMHLSEYLLRDFINAEKHMSPAGVIVLDDMLPRNPLEAARDRMTGPWTGDVYKVAEFLREHRPDLTVIPVNTSPTGTVIVVGLDPSSTVLADRYEDLLPVCLAEDPQQVPEDLMERIGSVDAAALLESPAWAQLVAARTDSADITAITATLAALPRVSRGS